MADRISIYHPPGRLGLGANPFGKDVANLQLFQALARHGGFSQVDILSFAPEGDAEVRAALLDEASTGVRCVAASVLDTAVPAASGVLLRGQPDLAELAWLRRRTGGDRAYSLMGLVHTLAPPIVRQIIANALVAPTRPWDAIICTSPSVRDALSQMFDDFGDYLGERTSGVRPPQPQLRIVPLGVNGDHYAALADRPDVRARMRAELGLSEDDVLVLWVGRLSYYEKAFPQPMFKALQAAKTTTGKRVAFVMAGWFPTPEDRPKYEEAARAHAPDVEVRFADGNDAERLGGLWAASDIFLSLVDNIQETFGLTPLEAMAAGRPVVASDWDGYRFTIRDGQEGFLVPTLLPPAGGLGAAMSIRHVLEAQAYQVYVGSLAQHTAVHVGRAAEALARLIADPELRRRMGAAGRERVRQAFDWKVVAPQINALADDLARRRREAAPVASRHGQHPVKGDPFRDFQGFATTSLTPQTPLRITPGATVDQVRALERLYLDGAFSSWRLDIEDCVQAFHLLASGQARTVGEVLSAFPQPKRRSLELSLIWLAKAGLVDWPI